MGLACARALGSSSLVPLPLPLSRKHRVLSSSLPPPSQTGIPARQEVLGMTLAGLQELVVYGLKGLAAYYVHASE